MESLRDIWGELGAQLRRYIARRVSDSHAADDIAQDVMLKVQTQLDALPPGDKLPSWVFAIARNAVIDHYRARSVREHADVADSAGAILIDEYRQGLAAAGFANVAVIDSGADLNAYSKVEGQSGCCSPAMSVESSTLPVASGGGCCGGSRPSHESSAVHGSLAEVLRRYDVNDYAASVKVYAVKPGA